MVWNVDSNVKVDTANGTISSDKTGYFNGTVIASGKVLDIVIVVKDADGNYNTIINSDNKYIYVAQNVATDLTKYTVELDGKYSAADGVTTVPEKDSGITVANGQLTTSKTGYYTVTFKTAAGDVDIVFAVTDGEYYTSDNYLFTMSDYYRGDYWKSYGTAWNDHILTSVSRVDNDAPYSRELIVPDRLYNVEVKTENYDHTLNKYETTKWSYQTVEQAGDNITNWVNIYEVGNAFSSGDYAGYVEKLSFGKYIEVIGDYAFHNYTSLKVLELPER